MRATSAIRQGGRCGSTRTRPRSAADRVLQASGLPASTRVDVIVEPDRVVVHIRRPVAMTFLRIAGLRAEDIGASATAGPQTG